MLAGSRIPKCLYDTTLVVKCCALLTMVFVLVWMDYYTERCELARFHKVHGKVFMGDGPVH